MLDQFPDVFRRSSGRTHLIHHDVDRGEAAPIKQSHYRVNSRKADIIRKELDDYMLDQGLIERKAKVNGARLGHSSPSLTVDIGSVLTTGR